MNRYPRMRPELVDENGDTVIIGDLIDKPTILNFVYYRCPGICSPLMDGLADVIDATDLAMLLTGVDIKSAKRRKRYSRVA